MEQSQTTLLLDNGAYSIKSAYLTDTKLRYHHFEKFRKISALTAMLSIEYFRMEFSRRELTAKECTFRMNLKTARTVPHSFTCFLLSVAILVIFWWEILIKINRSFQCIGISSCRCGIDYLRRADLMLIFKIAALYWRIPMRLLGFCQIHNISRLL